MNLKLRPEAKKRAASRETAVTDVVTVSYRECMPRTHSVFAGLAVSHPLSLKSRFYFPSYGTFSHQATISTIPQSDEGHRQRGLLITTAWEVKYRKTCTKASDLILE